MPKDRRFKKPAKTGPVREDPFDREDFRIWADDMRKRLIPKMEGSQSVLMLAPDLKADFDISFALQIGACILLEKPLILVIHPGKVVPPKLRTIADKIIEVNLDGVTMNDAEIQEQIRQAMTDLGKQ
jgi:hypothetical protein